MGPFTVSIIFAVGSSAWIYNQVQRRNGGLTQQSLVAAGVTGAVIFIIFLTIAVKIIPSN